MASEDREGKVDGFRHAEVAGTKSVEIPEDERVYGDVDAQHDVDVGHRELVVVVDRMSQVVPLDADTCRRQNTYSDVEMCMGMGLDSHGNPMGMGTQICHEWEREWEEYT